MKINRRWIFLTIIATLTIATAGVGRASTATMALSPSEVNDIDPGGTFNVNVTVTDVSNLFAWQYLIRFDPNVLHVDNVTEGPFLGSTGEQTFFLEPTIDNDKGFVITGCAFDPPYPEYGVTGDGVLATIVFSVTGRGSITLEFDEDETFTKLTEVRWVNYVERGHEENQGSKISISRDLADGTFKNGEPEILSLSLIIAIVGAVALCGVGAFYFMRRRRTG